MIVNNSNRLQIKNDAQISVPQRDIPVGVAENIEPAASIAVDASVMKAYTGVIDKDKVISKDELFNYFRQIGIMNEKRFDSMLASLAGKNGEVTEKTLEFLKSFQSKNHLIWNSLKIFDAAKEDGTINYGALKLADSIMNTNSKTMHSCDYDYCPEVLKSLKNSDGSFNKAAVKFFTKHAESFKPLFDFDPKCAFAPLKNNKGEIDLTALDYADKKLSGGESLNDVISQIYGAKNNDGNFSYEIKKLDDDLSKVFEKWRVNYVKKIALSFPKDKQKERDNFVEIAKSMKDDSDFSLIFDFIEKMKSTQNNRSALEYDRPSVEFIKNMLESSYHKTDVIEIILKKISQPYTSFTQKDIEILNTLCSTVNTENIETFIDASVRKAGENKGKFDSSTLKKYLDIYVNNYGVMSMPDIEYMAKCFSLEEDDYALETFAKLYNLKWTSNDRFTSEQRLDRKTLQFVLMMTTLEQDGIPKRKCYKPVLDNLNKLMTMKLPMSSKDAFENFIVYQDFDVIEKLEKVDFQELGLKTGQISSGIFKHATEEELLHFKEYLKDYLKDKRVESVDIQLNQNISSIVELTTGYDWDRKKLLYDIEKGRPTAEIHECEWNNRVTRKEHDFKNNTLTEIRHKIKEENFSKYEVLESLSFKKYDKNNNLIYEEVLEKSPLDGVFNIKRIYADGRIEKICSALKTNDGEIVEKNMESLDGTKTYYRYETDRKGNLILDYRITDKNQKELLNQSVTFEVIDENHFISSRNNQKHDIKVDKNYITIKNLQNGKTEKIELQNFTRNTEALLLPFLKSLPGDELFKMKELDLKAFYVTEKVPNAAYNPDDETIMTKEAYLDTAVLLHEWGHAKDSLMFKDINEKIKDDRILRKIYNEEKEAFRAHFGDSQLSEIGYFVADYHYLGSDSIQEGIAETNALLSTCPKNEVQAVRSHFWQQYFPRTIAYLAGILE